jgi:hypothetical protein
MQLGELMLRLGRERAVFHSEADLQHAFAWEAHRMDPDLRIRLETHPEPNVRLDLLISRPDLDRHGAIELKYLTAAWSGVVLGERFALKNQGAQDIRAYDVVKDIGVQSSALRRLRAGGGWECKGAPAWLGRPGVGTLATPENRAQSQGRVTS